MDMASSAFESMDQDGNGHISYAEFVASLASPPGAKSSVAGAVLKLLRARADGSDKRVGAQRDLPEEVRGLVFEIERLRPIVEQSLRTLSDDEIRRVSMPPQAKAPRMEDKWSQMKSIEELKSELRKLSKARACISQIHKAREFEDEPAGGGWR